MKQRKNLLKILIIRFYEWMFFRFRILLKFVENYKNFE